MPLGIIGIRRIAGAGGRGIDEAEIAALPPADSNPVSAELGGERTVPARPASWLPDPVGRHELRYWSGSEWTEHVADAGLQGVDPLP